MNYHITTIAAGTLATLVMVVPAVAGGDHPATDTQSDHTAIRSTLRMPMMNPAKGRELFVSKGCVVCHSVNGIGGEDAAALDAHDMDPNMGIFDLAAKMWINAPVMIPAQEDEVGGQIEFTGEELGNIIAFLHDDAEQHELTMESLSPEMQVKVKAMQGG
jgi:Cytochrome c